MNLKIIIFSINQTKFNSVELNWNTINIYKLMHNIYFSIILLYYFNQFVVNYYFNNNQ